MELGFVKSRRDRRILPNSFQKQEVKNIGRKRADEPRDFSILWMEIISEDFQMGERNSKTRKD